MKISDLDQVFYAFIDMFRVLIPFKDILSIQGEEINSVVAKKSAALKLMDANVQKVRKEANFLKNKLMVLYLYLK